MKAKDLIDLLGKVDPETEVLCCGDNMDLYSDIFAMDKTQFNGEVWLFGVDPKVMPIQETYGFWNYPDGTEE